MCFVFGVWSSFVFTFNPWLNKIDEVYNTNWCDSGVFIEKNPDYIYSAFAHSLQPIIENNLTNLK